MIQLDRFKHVIKNADELLIGSYKHEKIINEIKNAVFVLSSIKHIKTVV
jgi:hypothetical protein